MSTTPPLRALIVVRLSRVTEATTSPERQLEACRELCEARGYEVVGVAEDLDVSAGATTPFDRPKLGKWLQNRHHEIDVIVIYRMDRLVRRLLDLADIIRWAQEHDVAIVSAKEAFLDLTSPFGDVIAMLVAKVAEMELEAIAARNASAATHNIRSGKWRGGTPPWGYRPEKDAAGVWRLVQDSEQVDVIREVADWVIEGKQLRVIARDLTERGDLTPRDRYRQIKGEEPKGHSWSPSALKRSLLSPTLLGHIVTRDPLLDAQGRPRRDSRGRRVLGPEFVVVDDGGSPVVRAEPVLERKIFEQVGERLRERENKKERDTRSSSLLTGVLVCDICEGPAYRLKGGPGRQPRYRCGSKQSSTPCDNGSVALAWADAEVERATVGRLGHMERMRRTWSPGSDVGQELAEVEEELEDLTELIGRRVYKRGTPQRTRLFARIEALAQRQEELQVIPAVPSGWRYEGTGETVQQWWDRSDVVTRGDWLRETGVKASWVAVPEGGRTKVERFEVDLGSPDLDSPVLPGSVAAVAGTDDPLLRFVADLWWRQGGAAHEGVMPYDGDDRE